MKRPEIVAEFAAGDPVPEWLLTVEPTEAGTAPPRTVFAQDCCVVQMRSGYWIICHEAGGDAIIRIVGSGRYTLVAPGQPVVLSIQQMTVNTSD